MAVSNLSSPGGMASAVFDSVAASVETFTGALKDGSAGVASASAALIAPLQQAGAGMGRFVEAFSPSMTAQFQRAMYDLTAVIGSALAPAFSVLTSVVREVGAILVPVFQKIGEVLRPLAESLGSVFVTVVKTMANAFMALAPLIEAAVNVMIPLIEGMAALFNAVMIVVGALVGAFTGDLDPKKNGMVTMAESLKKLMEKLAGGLIIFMAGVAKAFGQLGVIQGLIKGLEAALKPPEKRAEGFGAVTNAQYSSFGEFGRRMALAASMATGEPEKKKDTNQWLEETLKEVKKINDSQQTLREILNDWGDDFAAALAAAIVESFPTAVSPEQGADIAVGWATGGFTGAALAALGFGGARPTPVPDAAR